MTRRWWNNNSGFNLTAAFVLYITAMITSSCHCQFHIFTRYISQDSVSTNQEQTKIPRLLPLFFLKGTLSVDTFRYCKNFLTGDTPVIHFTVQHYTCNNHEQYFWLKRGRLTKKPLNNKPCYLVILYDFILLRQMLWWCSHQRGTCDKFYNPVLHAFIYQLRATFLSFRVAGKCTTEDYFWLATWLNKNS